MKTLLRTLFFVSLAVGHFSCSRSDDDSSVGYFPTAINMENTNGASAHYEIGYNASNTIDNIALQRTISGISTSFLSEFNYNPQQRLVSATMQDLTNGVSRSMEFKYNENGNLIDILYVSNQTEKEVNLSHDVEVNSYSVSIDDYGFTLVLNSDDALKRILFPSSELTITPSDSGKGVFQHLQNRVPLQIWLVTSFGSNLDLFFFQNKDISNLLIDENNFAYGNKSWDVNGNLLTYSITNANDPLTTNYTIQYIARDL